MAFKIRPFTEADYAACVAIACAWYENATTVERMRHLDRNRDPRCQCRRWVAVESNTNKVESGLRIRGFSGLDEIVEGQTVGSGEYAQSYRLYHPRKFDLNVAVLPSHQRQGIGGALYDTVTTALQPFDPITLSTELREDWPGVPFAEQRGWRERMRFWESELDLTRLDLAPIAQKMARAEAQGYAVKSYAELAAGPEGEHKLFALLMELTRDVPAPEPPTDVPFETWRRNHLQRPNFWPEGYMVAVKDGEWVGVSSMWTTETPGLIDTGLTGVRRAHRGTGAAQLLKGRALMHCRAAGYQRTRTGNESNNHKMLAINNQLGFVRQPAWIAYQLHLQPEA